MHKKGKVHPSPPSVAGHLSLLPAALLTLAASLSADDKQILAYLISCCGADNINPDTNGFSGHRKKVQNKSTVDSDSHGGGVEHDPVFECNCFNCYLSYWARWDVSAKREVIHEIIEAYEEWLLKKKKKKSWRKKKEKTKRVCDELMKKNGAEEEKLVVKDGFGIGGFELAEKNSIYSIQQDEEDEVVQLEKSIVRKISSFVGDKIWGFWGIN